MYQVYCCSNIAVAYDSLVENIQTGPNVTLELITITIASHE